MKRHLVVKRGEQGEEGSTKENPKVTTSGEEKVAAQSPVSEHL